MSEETNPMSATPPMSSDVAELFEWRAAGLVPWLATARRVSALLAEVEAGRMDATPAEMVGLRAFVATVEGMAAER